MASIHLDFVVLKWRWMVKIIIYYTIQMKWYTGQYWLKCEAMSFLSLFCLIDADGRRHFAEFNREKEIIYFLYFDHLLELEPISYPVVWGPLFCSGFIKQISFLIVFIPYFERLN